MDESTGPCESWPVTGCGGSPPVTGAAVAAATEVLWALSGRQFGICEVTVRPCVHGCLQPVWPAWSYGGYLPDWGWINWIDVACGECGQGCSCSTVQKVILPGYVHSVIEVSINGETMPATGYYLKDHRELIRTDGSQWPKCQDWNVQSGAGVWTVTAGFGLPVPEIGKLAATELANEIAAACDPAAECVLPQGVIEVTRSGVSYNIGLFDFLKEGKTGLRLCDMFLAAYNPAGLKRRSRVYSPDLLA